MGIRLRTILQFFTRHLRSNDVCRTYKILHVCRPKPGMRQPLTLGRTTVTTITTTSYESLITVTVPEVTVFATTTITSGERIHKRQGDVYHGPLEVASPPIAPTAIRDPIISIFPSITQNELIAAAAYSACSCLDIKSSTVTAQPTMQFV